jgi:hypothetical protein
VINPWKSLPPRSAFTTRTNSSREANQFSARRAGRDP